jgi:hypothetical protein
MQNQGLFNIENLVLRASSDFNGFAKSYIVTNFLVQLGARSSLFYILNIETGDPPAGWGVRRTISNKEFRTAEVLEKNETMFFTSIFCGSAVHFVDDLIADSCNAEGSGWSSPVKFIQPSFQPQRPQYFVWQQ